jgi:hypothetical protein
MSLRANKIDAVVDGLRTALTATIGESPAASVAIERFLSNLERLIISLDDATVDQLHHQITIWRSDAILDELDYWKERAAHFENENQELKAQQ